MAWLTRRAPLKGATLFGPFDPEGAWRDLAWSLGHGTAVFAASAALMIAARRWSRAAAAGAVLLLTIDLAACVSPLVFTAPQSVFETTPLIVEKIEEAEAADPSPGPFRIHRMAYWDPFAFTAASSPDRLREQMEWERKTIQPKYAIPYGLSYTQTEGVADLYDYSWFFSPWPVPRNMLGGAKAEAGDAGIIYFPRRGYDLWATRYFVVPSVPANVEYRACYSFLDDSRPIYPTNAQTTGPGARAFLEHWDQHEDWRLLKNDRAFPRAWIVHKIELLEPIEGFSQKAREGRKSLIEALVYPADRYWNTPSRQVRDLRDMAFVESDDRKALFDRFSYKRPDPTETVEFVVDDDPKVVIRATLRSAGLLVLADVNYPGWKLYVDGKPTEILTTNRLMRGVPLSEGTHRIVFVYDPMSARMGMAISASGLVIAAGVLMRSRVRPRVERLATL